MISQKALIKKLSEYSSFVITTHKNCDGDGLGTGLALYHSFKQKGWEVQFLTLDDIPPKYQFFNSENEIQTFSKDSPLPKDFLLVVVDTNDFRVIEPLYSQCKGEMVFIDHHPLVNPQIQKQKKKEHYFIDTKASSTGEIGFSLIKNFGTTLNEKIATCLYTSIIFDTKMFRSIKNSPVPFALSAELIPHIPNVNVIYNHLFKNLSPQTLSFFSKLKDVEYHFQNSFALLSISKEEIKKHKAGIGDACELLDLIMNVHSVQSATLIFETDEGFKLSFRSAEKSIFSVAKKFNGGGHHLSGGAFVDSQKLDDLKKQIVLAFKALLTT